MATEYRLSYTGQEIDEKLRQVETLQETKLDASKLDSAIETILEDSGMTKTVNGITPDKNGAITIDSKHIPINLSDDEYYDDASIYEAFVSLIDEIVLLTDTLTLTAGDYDGDGVVDLSINAPVVGDVTNAKVEVSGEKITDPQTVSEWISAIL
jgi:hypothetical protein